MICDQRDRDDQLGHPVGQLPPWSVYAIALGVGSLVVYVTWRIVRPNPTGTGMLDTVNILRKVMPRLSLAKATLYAPALSSAMQEAQINTPARISAFLAQLALESGELRYFEEIWVPTARQLTYEGRASLGNTQPGDGFRYRGRGPIQLTGRYNYRTAGKALGIDLENNPDLAARPAIGFRVAAWYWTSRNLNEKADRGDFVGITKAINGGLLGHDKRVAYYERAKSVFAEAGAVAGLPERPRGCNLT